MLIYLLWFRFLAVLFWLTFFFSLLQNFLFVSKDENSTLKAIDFGLSDYVKPGKDSTSDISFWLILNSRLGLTIIFADERLNDIVGSAYYVAPEVLHRSYGTEGDMWSIGVIAYILLCGSRPFWARTESGIFRAVLKADPSFDEAPWPALSSDARDFVKRLLNKDFRKRLTAAQALSKSLKWSKHFRVLIWTMDSRHISYVHATSFLHYFHLVFIQW